MGNEQVLKQEWHPEDRNRKHVSTMMGSNFSNYAKKVAIAKIGRAFAGSELQSDTKLIVVNPLTLALFSVKQKATNEKYKK